MRITKLIYNFLNRKKINIVFKDLLIDAEIEANENRKRGKVDLFPVLVAKNRLREVIKSGKLNKKYNEILQGSV